MADAVATALGVASGVVGHPASNPPLLPLTDEEFWEIVTVADENKAPKKPAPRAHNWWARLKWKQLLLFQAAMYIRRFLFLTLIVVVFYGRVEGQSTRGMSPSAWVLDSLGVPLAQQDGFHVMRLSSPPEAGSESSLLSSGALDPDEFDVHTMPSKPATASSSAASDARLVAMASGGLMDAFSRLLGAVPILFVYFARASLLAAVSLPVWVRLMRQPIELSDWSFGLRRLLLLCYRWLAPVAVWYYAALIAIGDMPSAMWEDAAVRMAFDVFIDWRWWSVVYVLLLLAGVRLVSSPPLLLFEEDIGATYSAEQCPDNFRWWNQSIAKALEYGCAFVCAIVLLLWRTWYTVVESGERVAAFRALALITIAAHVLVLVCVVRWLVDSFRRVPVRRKQQ